ncbi:carbohydrate sulfotransferase 11 isoform X2 [Aethina tumida]|uniref:carbohydrate sulfotransferase 11 isoform X2 n=1 Tax=Aethina tumida TaxID=116153 RepID=UPI00096B52E3|nr:carbohydrate sulfotransferase 11 isoform X2 [Aethina tumida]
MVEEAPRTDLKTEISQSDIETLTHEDLLEITQSSLRRLTASDPLLQDLPVDVTLEEVLSQIAVLQGQSITVTIDRYSEPALSVVVLACTNWKRVMMVLTGKANVTKLTDIPSEAVHTVNATIKLSNLSSKEAKDCLNTYTNFLMVRHPFERLLSAYRNKFEGPSVYFKLRFGRYIIKNYRTNATDSEVETGRPSFSEFVRYIIKEGLRENEHWTPIYDLCHPCSINYTFVGRYETLGQDSTTILDMIGAPPIVFPATRTHGTSDLVRDYLQQLSITEIGELRKLYQRDFEMFGYNLESLLGYDLA